MKNIKTLLLLALLSLVFPQVSKANENTCLFPVYLTFSDCYVELTELPTILNDKEFYLADNLMNHWFDGTGDNYYIDFNTTRSLDKNLNEKVSLYEKNAVNNKLLTENMKGFLRIVLENDPNINTSSQHTQSFSYTTLESASFANGWKENTNWEKNNLYYISDEKINSYGITPIGSSLGRYSLRIVVDGTLYNNTVTISNIGFYVRDTYDFVGSQLGGLGCWGKKPNRTFPQIGGLCPKGTSGGENMRSINNKDYRQFNLNNNKEENYGNFLVFSNIHTISTNQSFIYSYSKPYFDGTGSLIDPQNSCDGCERDYVELHSHGDQPSAGFFQVYRIPNVCESIRIDGLGAGSVEVRSWSGMGKDSNYYSIDTSSNIIPLNKNTWSLIAFKTNNPILSNSTKSVKASCLSNNYSNATKIPGTPMEFDYNYYWGGNGSLINHSNNQHDPNLQDERESDAQAGFGRNKDTAVLLSNKKTLSVFQVSTHNETCKKVKFVTPVSFNLSWKFWSDKEWEGSRRISNGDYFTFPVDRHWWILKIKAPAISSTGKRIDVICQ